MMTEAVTVVYLASATWLVIGSLTCRHFYKEGKNRGKIEILDRQETRRNEGINLDLPPESAIGASDGTYRVSSEWWKQNEKNLKDLTMYRGDGDFMDD